jgi:hypothetical protein
MASRRVCDVDDIMSILDYSNENVSYDSSSGSNYEIFDTNTSKSVTSDSDTLVTHVSSHWLQVTDCDCEYIDYAIVDSRQGVVLHLGSLTRV